MGRIMGFLGKAIRQAKRLGDREVDGPVGVLPLLKQCKSLMGAVTSFELALLASEKVEARVKSLAQIKTSALIGCPF